MQKPVMLLILDGWGYRANVTPDNAIEQGHTPNWHNLLATCPHCFVETSGYDVGLPEGQMGNSEVGHTNLGAGRVVMQDLPKIDLAIKDGSLEKNPTLVELINKLKEIKGTCHLMGLMSPGGVHSHQKHIEAVCGILQKNGINVDVHAFLDGRDTPPQSGKGFLSDFENNIKDMPNVKLATIAGRFYAMDRDKRWARTQKAYDAITLHSGKTFASAAEGVEASYAAGVTDEFVEPFVVASENDSRVKDGDGVIFYNFRPDRARQLTRAFTDKDFAGFERAKLNVAFVCMTQYDATIDAAVAFPPETLVNTLGEVLAKNNLRQLRIAETEKYAHVTFFFNGGVETPNELEDRVLIPSPQVATYDLQPEMSAYEVTDKLLALLDEDKYDVVILNFANPDMVGHTGVMDAAVKAMEAVDTCAGKIVKKVLALGGAVCITADHGNLEKMYDGETNQPYTAHTTNPVPFLMVSADRPKLHEGILADIAPTLLELLGIAQPAEMTGHSLIEK